MSKDSPTRSQTLILELLSAFEYLTTREICEYLAEPTTKRAVEQKLQLLLKHGFIRSELLNPLLGRASECRWSLLKKGCDILGAIYEPPESSEASIKRGATPREAAVLYLLSEMKHLTTGQIRRHLHSNKPEWHTGQLLNVLQGLGYIRGKRMYPEMGAASECYWTIRKAGAAAIDATYDRRYLRRPARQTIEHRDMLLEMSRHVEAAGWSLIKPVTRNPRRAGSGERQAEGTRDTPQRKQLVEAVLSKEASTIQRLVEQGYPVTGLLDRIERLKAGQVGAVMPRAINEYVAYLPGEPEQTVLLIPHPPWVGRAFWARRPGRRQNNTGRQDEHRARLAKYARLAKVLPVLGVFAHEEGAEQYSGLLAAAGLRWTLVEDVGDKLLEITGLSPGNAEA